MKLISQFLGLLLRRFLVDARGATKKAAAIGGAVLALSAGGAAFVATEEGTLFNAYKDVVGVWTICTGHTGQVIIDGVSYGTVRDGMKLTKAQCETLLKQDSEHARQILNTCVKRLLGQNQSDALISFIINVGPKGCQSEVIRRINTGDFAGASQVFVNWSLAGGKPILRNRRLREAALFRKPDNDNFPWDTTEGRLKALAKVQS